MPHVIIPREFSFSRDFRNIAVDAVTRRTQEAATHAIEVLSPALKETPFAFACDMIMADGFVGEDEMDFLTSLALQKEITEDLGNAIVTTTMICNRNVDSA